VGRWSAAERRALVEVIRAKGGPSESEFARRFDRHRRLREAIRRLALRADAANP
jgi:predicted transcriptional regulator